MLFIGILAVSKSRVLDYQLLWMGKNWKFSSRLASSLEELFLDGNFLGRNCPNGSYPGG